MFIGALIIYLLELYEFRNCYLIIILAFYCMKVVMTNLSAILGLFCNLI